MSLIMSSRRAGSADEYDLRHISGSSWVNDSYGKTMKYGQRSNAYMRSMHVNSKEGGLTDIAQALAAMHTVQNKAADATPLGLTAFAGTTFILSCMNAGFLVDQQSSSTGVVLGMAMAFGGLTQLIAGILVYQVGNMFAGTLFCAYGGFWISYASLFVDAFGFLDGYTGPDAKEDLDDGLGVFLLSWAIFTFTMTIVALRTNVVLLVTLFLLGWTFVCLSAGHFDGDSQQWRQAGGILGIIISFLAWYKAVAVFLTKDTAFFTLPIGQLDPIYERWGWLPKQKVDDEEGEEEVYHQDESDKVLVRETTAQRNLSGDSDEEGEGEEAKKDMRRRELEANSNEQLRDLPPVEEGQEEGDVERGGKYNQVPVPTDGPEEGTSDDQQSMTWTAIPSSSNLA